MKTKTIQRQTTQPVEYARPAVRCRLPLEGEFPEGGDVRLVLVRGDGARLPVRVAPIGTKPQRWLSFGRDGELLDDPAVINWEGA